MAEWADLPYDCLRNILSWLTFKERWCGPMFVCKSWLNACLDYSLYKFIDLETHFISAKPSPLWWSPEFERKIDSMLRNFVNLSKGQITEVHTRHCSDRSLIFMADRCQRLEVLSIKGSRNVTDLSMTLIAFNCTNLIELDISFCYRISDKSLVIIGWNCPNLRILKRHLYNNLDPWQHVCHQEYLDTCPQDGDSEAAAIAEFMPHLQHLELCFSKLTAKGLSAICKGCLKLGYLDLSGCENLKSTDIIDATIKLTALEVIIEPDLYFSRLVFCRTDTTDPQEILDWTDRTDPHDYHLGFTSRDHYFGPIPGPLSLEGNY